MCHEGLSTGLALYAQGTIRKGTSHASVTLLSHNRFRGDERTVGTMRPRLGSWRLVAAAAAVAGALAIPALPAAAAPVAPHGSRFRACTGRFTSGASYWRVKQHLPFAFPPHFTVATLILFAATGGNAPTSPISGTGFPAP
jgi:hypothetical protein